MFRKAGGHLDCEDDPCFSSLTLLIVSLIQETVLLEKMLIRVFAIPCLLLFATLVVPWFLGYYVPSLFNGSPYLSGLNQQVVGLAIPVFWLLACAAILAFFYQGFQLWRWNQGSTDSCDNCGGMVSPRDGRYGPYYHCLACGKNRSV